MISILRFLGLTAAPTASGESAETDTVRKIVAQLEALEPERARYVAAFAYILSRVAHADMSISPEETRAMERIVVERGHLPPQQAVLVVQMAKTQARLFGGTENYLVTREFERLAPREDKLALLDCLYAVSAADHTVSGAEDRVIRQIADELKLDHADFIEVRRRYRDRLGVFQDPAPES